MTTDLHDMFISKYFSLPYKKSISVIQCITQMPHTCTLTLLQAGDGETCVTCPQDCAGNVGGDTTVHAPFCCGMSASTRRSHNSHSSNNISSNNSNMVGCMASLCNNEQWHCRETPVVQACAGDGVCQGQETKENTRDCSVPLLLPSSPNQGEVSRTLYCAHCIQ